jgi:hypothetical protein
MVGWDNRGDNVAARRLSRKAISYNFSMAYLALGDKDTALQALESAYKAHQSTVPWLRVRCFGLDAMFDDIRFQDLVRRMNLPPAGGK